MSKQPVLHPSNERFIEQPRFRPEIQGLRSLAVLLVVTYHVWFGRVSGGVDVFLFISAFLLSLSSLRKIHDGKPLQVIKYWLHVFQRLLPAALVVILGTLVAAYFIVAPSRWSSLLADAKAAVFYFLNWRLAHNAVDYYAQDATTKTPFQHFWSLSMQGQIFILWPLLFTLVGFLVWYLRLKTTGVALLIFGSVFVASLTFSIKETATNQAFAYFDTRTRLWEFAAGALLAILLLKWQAPRKARVVMGWVGIAGLVSAGWLLPIETGFPGYLALWPLLSGAMVIAAGQTDSKFGADRFLSAAPLQKMGAISYCLYLVHWPALILYTTAVGKEQAGWIDGSVIILGSIALAWVLHTCVEKPMRALDRKPLMRARRKQATDAPRLPWAKKPSMASKLAGYRRPAATLAVLLALASLPLSAAQAWVNKQEEETMARAETAGSAAYPGALASDLNARYRDLPVPLADPVSQFDGLSESCTGQFAVINPELEQFCSAQAWGAEDSPLTIIVGDSHAQQSISMMRPIARDNRMTLMTYLLGGCKFPTTSSWADCNNFSTAMIEEILAQNPANVVLISSVSMDNDPNDGTPPRYDEAVQRFTDAGINVIGIRDNPRYEYNMYICGQENMRSLYDCGANRADKVAGPSPDNDLMENTNYFSIDLTEQLCPQGWCPAIMGNVFIYIDDNHISKAYGQTLSPFVQQQLQAQEWNPWGGTSPEDYGNEEDAFADALTENGEL